MSPDEAGVWWKQRAVICGDVGTKVKEQHFKLQPFPGKVLAFSFDYTTLCVTTDEMDVFCHRILR